MHPNSMPLMRASTEQSAELLWPPRLVVPDTLKEIMKVPDAFTSGSWITRESLSVM